MADNFVFAGDVMCLQTCISSSADDTKMCSKGVSSAPYKVRQHWACVSFVWVHAYRS